MLRNVIFDVTRPLIFAANRRLHLESFEAELVQFASLFGLIPPVLKVIPRLHKFLVDSVCRPNIKVAEQNDCRCTELFANTDRPRVRRIYPRNQSPIATRNHPQSRWEPCSFPWWNFLTIPLMKFRLGAKLPPFLRESAWQVQQFHLSKVEPHHSQQTS